MLFRGVTRFSHAVPWRDGRRDACPFLAQSVLVFLILTLSHHIGVVVSLEFMLCASNQFAMLHIRHLRTVWFSPHRQFSVAVSLASPLHGPQNYKSFVTLNVVVQCTKNALRTCSHGVRVVFLPQEAGAWMLQLISFEIVMTAEVQQPSCTSRQKR